MCDSSIMRCAYSKNDANMIRRYMREISFFVRSRESQSMGHESVFMSFSSISIPPSDRAIDSMISSPRLAMMREQR